MNDLKDIDLEKIRKKFKETQLTQEDAYHQLELLKSNKFLYFLGRMGLSILFNNSEDLPSIIEESYKDAEEQRKYIENKERDYHYWYDKSLEPFSKEFGCAHCGGYCYTPFKSSNCQVEGCEAEGKLLVYCPKISCGFGLMCESQTLPLGCWFEHNDYTTDDHLKIHYNSKIYTFRVKKWLTTSFIISLIREFFGYNLTRSEINEWITLENISNENQ